MFYFTFNCCLSKNIILNLYIMGVFYILSRGSQNTAAAAKRLFFFTLLYCSANRKDPTSVSWNAESAELSSRLVAANTSSHVT